MNPPVARHLDAVSPSLAHNLQECMLRVAFGQSSRGPRPPSDAQIVGDAVHAVLADLVESGAIRDGEHLHRLDDRFYAALAERAPGREVRRARPATARLKKVVQHVRTLLERAGPEVETLCEKRLLARRGALQGVVDLVVCSTSVHAVVDYKTGTVLDDEGEMLAHYRTQLALYAVLEGERSGSWPSRGVLLRFGGAPVSVELSPQGCSAAADNAVRALSRYNEFAGTTPPASPGEFACRFCNFAPRCEAFWQAVSPGWQIPGAVRGTVAWTELSAVGGMTVGLRDVEGTLDRDVVARRLPFDGLDEPPEGAVLAICGVTPDADGRLVASKAVRWELASRSDGDEAPLALSTEQ